MSETISMTDILLTVSVGCNLWFLFLLLYDRIMETRLVRFLRSIAGVWRSLGGTAAKPETVRDTPPADTPDIIGKSRFRMAPTRTRSTPSKRNNWAVSRETAGNRGSQCLISNLYGKIPRR